MHGLPWSNPQKLTIGSDEHILDTTINRGLIMLLQNDYYLETRGHIFSQEISALYDDTETLLSTIQKHIEDTSAHHSSTGDNISYAQYTVDYQPQYTINVQQGQSIDLTQLVKETVTDALTEDTICFLPIDKSAAVLNKKIESYPKNLNGYTLFLVFTVPTNYNRFKGINFDNSLSAQYILDVENDSIRVESFFNGTIVIVGDYLHRTIIDDEVNFSKPTEKD